MGTKNNKGKGLVFFFLIIVALAGAFTSYFPLVEVKFPEVAKKINNFRGAYSGPLFNDDLSVGDDYFTNQYHGFKSVMEEEQIFYFVPKEDITFKIGAFYDADTKQLIEIDVYNADNMNEPIETNLDVPYVTGRQVGAYSQMGEEVPDHANWLSVKCNKDTKYAVRVIPEDSAGIGKDFIVRLDAAEGWISMQGLWIAFTVIMFFLFIGLTLLRVLLRVRK